jgi:hypothetical protein
VFNSLKQNALEFLLSLKLERKFILKKSAEFFKQNEIALLAT